MTIPILLLMAAISTLLLVHGFRTGKSVVRFPRPTYRDENPLWFWFGQAMFAAAVLIVLLLFAEKVGISN